MSVQKVNVLLDSKRERHKFYNTLCGIVKCLENRNILVDLRNECSVSGLIINVDGFMNIEMKNAVFYDPYQKQHSFESFYIRGRNIRYVHLPKNFQAKEMFYEHILAWMSRPKTKKAPTFKEKRATKYTQQIREEIESKNT